MVSGRGRIVLIMLVAVVVLAVGETLLSKGMKQAAGAAEGGLPSAPPWRRAAGSGRGASCCFSILDSTCSP